MGSEQGQSPCPFSGVESRSVPAAPGSIMDVAALPSACLDGRMGRSPAQALILEVGSTMAPLLLPVPLHRHLHSLASCAWGQEPWWDPRSLLL